MIQSTTYKIGIDPSDSAEYRWWAKNRERMKHEGYTLHEDVTSVWYAERTDTIIGELKGEENEQSSTCD